MIAFDPKNVKVTFDHKHDHDHDHDHEIVEEWLNNTLHQRLSWLEKEADGGDLDLEFEYMENNEGEELEIQFTWLEDSPKIKVNSCQETNIQKSLTQYAVDQTEISFNHVHPVSL